MVQQLKAILGHTELIPFGVIREWKPRLLNIYYLQYLLYSKVVSLSKNIIAKKYKIFIIEL